MISFFVMRYREVKGHWPLTKAKKSVQPSADTGSEELGGEKPASRGVGDKAVPRDEVTVLGV
jgi:high-affinity iron transporter